MEKEYKTTFGDKLKKDLPWEFVKKINQFETLSQDEREILQTIKINDSEKHLKSIRMNMLFFVWVFIVSVVLGVIVIVMNTK
ncbi:hypothetical protein CAPN008_11680 [Capnocytophaga canis]|uniref:hypothetical protein n=1 Tax=Capnocytophaga canis TaxID=1848903 RepID=UPI001ACBBEE6|nr:hypothetical protein [Capnocytophaga canis]GIM61118.1 hypothetical protein CAPN008_11680 [Capnocytophaga canis]